MNRLQANLCLLCVTLLWSTETIIFTAIPNTVSPFATTAITNLIVAALLMLSFSGRILAFLRRYGRRLLPHCLLLAALNIGYNVLYLYGLQFFDVSSGAFTLSLTVVILPVILLARRSSVGRATWLSSLLILIGILIGLSRHFHLLRPAGMLLIGAGCVLDAVYIIQLNGYAREDDPIALSAMTALIVGVGSYLIWFVLQPGTFAAIGWTDQILASLFIDGYFIVAFAQTLNYFAQQRTTPVSAAIIYSLEIVFTLLWGLLLPESIIDPVEPSRRMLIAVCFILAGNLVELTLPEGQENGKEVREHA